MSNELRPCPFCGDSAELRGGKGVASWIICNNTKCRATQGLELTGENAVKMWNSRPIEDMLRAQIKTATHICHGCEHQCCTHLDKPAKPTKCLLFDGRVAKWREL